MMVVGSPAGHAATVPERMLAGAIASNSSGAQNCGLGNFFGCCICATPCDCSQGLHEEGQCSWQCFQYCCNNTEDVLCNCSMQPR